MGYFPLPPCPPAIPACRIVQVSLLIVRGVVGAWRFYDALGRDVETLSDPPANLEVMAVYSGDFEVRRMQVNWSQDSGDPMGDDVRVCTFHHIKLSGGTPVDTWASGDFEAIRDAFLVFWTAIKDKYADRTRLKRIAFYRAGPGIVPPQPPVFESLHDLPGLVTGTYQQLPPQVAMTVTERSSATTHKGWGRFYLPAPVSTAVTLGVLGRIPSAWAGEIADGADVFYEACATANVPVVIYRPALPERPKKPSGTLPPRSATALSVDTLQIDDIYDVQRRRRWDRPLLRTLRGVGA